MYIDHDLQKKWKIIVLTRLLVTKKSPREHVRIIALIYICCQGMWTHKINRMIITINPCHFLLTNKSWDLIIWNCKNNSLWFFPVVLWLYTYKGVMQIQYWTVNSWSYRICTIFYTLYNFKQLHYAPKFWDMYIQCKRVLHYSNQYIYTRLMKPFKFQGKFWCSFS